jgi:hypothetical protein
MVTDTKQSIARLGVNVIIAVMILAAIYKIAWLLLGAITSGVRPRSGFDVANLFEGPAYLLSALTAWKWPWIGEGVSILTLIVIFASFSQLTISPVQKAFFVDSVFIIAANAVFFASMAMSKPKKENA